MARLPLNTVAYVSPGTRGHVRGDGKRYLFGKTTYPPGGRCGPRIQADFQLVVLLQGSLRLTVDGAVHDLAPGEAILEHPGAHEFYRFSPEAESVHTWCQMAPRFLSVADRRLLKRATRICQTPSSVHLLIEEGLAVQDQGGPDLQDAMAALARACLLRFAAHAGTLDRREHTAPLHPVLQRALDLATSHFAELHSGEDLARRVGISPSRLRTLCRAARGESPSDLIWRLKVEHALQLIRSTGLTLGEIAEDCGYANPFHLSRAVRRHTGHSPRSLRQAEWGR